MASPNLELIGSFDLENSYALSYLKTRPYEFAQESVDSLLRSLRDEWNMYLAQGIKEGMTIYELTEVVQNIFKGTEREEWYRARRIARSESVGAANMGTVSAYKQANVPGKTWVTVRDGLVRASHRVMDMVTVPTNEKFVLPDGARMEAPGDPAGGAKNVANCRCTIIAEFDPNAISKAP